MADITGELVLATFDDGANGQGSGDNLADRSSNARLFRLGSATGADTADMGWGASPARGTFGGDDYVYIPGGTGSLIAAWAPATANFTTIFLARFNDTTGSTSVKRALIAQAASGDRAGMINMVGGGGLDTLVGGTKLTSALGVVTQGQWHFVIARRDGVNGILRIDNTVVASSAAIANGTQGSNYALGANPGFSHFLIGDEAVWEIYGAALTDAQIDEELQHILATYAEPRGISVPGVPLTSTAVDVASSAHAYTAERVTTLVTATDSLQPHTAERAGVSAAPANSTQAQAAQSAPVGALPADSTHPHAAEQAGATARAEGTGHAHISEAVGALVTASDSTHAHQAGTAATVAGAEDSSSAQLSERAAVTVGASESTHSHTSETVEVVAAAVTIASGTHAQLSEQARVEVSARDSPHAHLSETVAVSAAVSASNHPHGAQSAQVGGSVAGDLHAHASEPVAVTLTPQDTVHPHLSATATLGGAAVGYITRPGIRDASAVRVLRDASPIRAVADASRTRAVQDSSKTRSIQDA